MQASPGNEHFNLCKCFGSLLCTLHAGRRLVARCLFFTSVGSWPYIGSGRQVEAGGYVVDILNLRSMACRVPSTSTLPLSVMARSKPHGTTYGTQGPRDPRALACAGCETVGC